MDLKKYRNKLRNGDNEMHRIIKNHITQKRKEKKENLMDVTCENM